MLGPFWHVLHNALPHVSPGSAFHGVALITVITSYFKDSDWLFPFLIIYNQEALCLLYWKIRIFRKSALRICHKIATQLIHGDDGIFLTHFKAIFFAIFASEVNFNMDFFASCEIACVLTKYLSKWRRPFWSKFLWLKIPIHYEWKY